MEEKNQNVKIKMPGNVSNKINEVKNVLVCDDEVVLGVPPKYQNGKEECSPSCSDNKQEMSNSTIKEEEREEEGEKGKGEKKLLYCLSHLQNIFGRIVPYGGISSSVFSLVSVCLGAGILGLPAATNSSGLVMALLYLIILAFFGVYSLHILSITIEKTGFRTFESMAKGLIGHRFDYFVSFIRWMNSFGATVAYVISIGDIIGPVLDNLSGLPSALHGNNGRRIFTCVVWFIFLLPLVIPKQVNSLRYVSAAAVIFVLYFVILVVVHSSINGIPYVKSKDEDGIKLFSTGNSAIHGLGVFMFAFVCQINCYEIYWEMKNRSTARFTLAGAIAMGLCVIAYALTAFFGYAEFGNKVHSSILLMYNPVAESAVLVGYVGMLFKLCASYSLQTMAYRNTIYHIIGWDVETLPYWKHILFVILFSLVVLICGLFIPNINTVFGLLGAICGGFLSFVFPALFYLYSGGWTLNSVGFFHYFFTHGLLIAGVIGIVFGTVSSFEATINS